MDFPSPVAERFEFSAEFEQAILAAISHVAGFGQIYSQDLSPRYFTQVAHEAWAKAGLQLASQYGRQPSTVAIREATGLLVGTVGYEALAGPDLDALKVAVDRAAQQDLGYAVERCKRWIKRQLLLGLTMQARTALEQDPAAYEQRLAKALQFGETMAGDDQVHGYFGGAARRLEARRSPKYDRFVSTGVQKLDGLLVGGLRAGKLGVIIAPSRGGKSALMVDIGAGALEQGKKVLHVSLEIAARDLAERYDTRLSGIPKQLLRQYEQQVGHRLLEVAKCGGDLVIQFWTPGSANAANIRALILKLKESGWGPDLLLVDYATKFKDAEPVRDERIAVAKRFQSIFSLAREFDLPTWSGAQGNRGSFQKKRVELSDIAECWDIIATTDVALLLGADADMESRSITNINKGKDRDFGNEVAADFSFQKEMCRFE